MKWLVSVDGTDLSLYYEVITGCVAAQERDCLWPWVCDPLGSHSLVYSMMFRLWNMVQFISHMES